MNEIIPIRFPCQSEKSFGIIIYSNRSVILLATSISIEKILSMNLLLLKRRKYSRKSSQEIRKDKHEKKQQQKTSEVNFL